MYASIYLFLTVLDLCCCKCLPLAAVSRGWWVGGGFLISIAVHGPFTAGASLVWSTGSGVLRRQEPQHVGSVVLGRGI